MCHFHLFPLVFFAQFIGLIFVKYIVQLEGLGFCFFFNLFIFVGLVCYFSPGRCVSKTDWGGGGVLLCFRA